jgi:hypothetical protein
MKYPTKSLSAYHFGSELGFHDNEPVVRLYVARWPLENELLNEYPLRNFFRHELPDMVLSVEEWGDLKSVLLEAAEFCAAKETTK